MEDTSDITYKDTNINMGKTSNTNKITSSINNDSGAENEVGDMSPWWERIVQIVTNN